MPSCDFGGECNCVSCQQAEEEWQKRKNDDNYLKRQQELRDKYSEMMREERLKNELQSQDRYSPVTYNESFILTRGKMKGKTFKEASKNKNYIQYCKLNAKHEELKALVEYAEKV